MFETIDWLHKWFELSINFNRLQLYKLTSQGEGIYAH